MLKEKIFKIFIIFLFLLFCFSVHNSVSNIYVTSQGLNVRKYIGLSKHDYKLFTGQGITVAIIDSGISYHNDINSKRVKKFVDFVNYKDDLYDDNGHGTTIAGIIGSNGKMKGIAPNVNFVIIKALDSEGITDREIMCKAIDWVSEYKNTYDIKVVNISVGVAPYKDSASDPIIQSINKLKETGVIIVCSAGNEGPMIKSILSPGISSNVITVGSCKNNKTYSFLDDDITSFSSRGYSGSGLNKPDIVTFGVDIFSLDYKDKKGYSIHSGTSYSTGIVSGVTAILMQKFSEKPISYIEQKIRNSTVSIYNANSDSQGKGELKIT